MLYSQNVQLKYYLITICIQTWEELESDTVGTNSRLSTRGPIVIMDYVQPKSKFFKKGLKFIANKPAYVKTWTKFYVTKIWGFFS